MKSFFFRHGLLSADSLDGVRGQLCYFLQATNWYLPRGVLQRAGELGWVDGFVPGRCCCGTTTA